jgi:hypothetical protein
MLAVAPIEHFEGVELRRCKPLRELRGGPRLRLEVIRHRFGLRGSNGRGQQASGGADEGGASQASNVMNCKLSQKFQLCSGSVRLDLSGTAPRPGFEGARFARVVAHPLLERTCFN